MLCLFAAEVPNPAQDRSALVRMLLRRAYDLVWDEDCPALEKTPAGKPWFPSRPERFLSLSHSRTFVLVALSDVPVGADVETVRPVSDRLRDRLFRPEEQADFGFFEGWTLRESVYKLTGAGSLWTMPLSLRDGMIQTPYPGVSCRIYHDLPGCVAAVAARADCDVLPHCVTRLSLCGGE